MVAILRFILANTCIYPSPRVVDQAIKLALRQRPSSLHSHPSFTNQDTFYTHVSYLEDIFPALLATEEDLLPSFSSPNERIQLVLNMAAILEAMLHEAVQYRQAKSSLYQSCLTSEVPEPEWLPWTGSACRCCRCCRCD